MRRRRRQGRTEADAAAGAPEAQAGRGSDEIADPPLARATPGSAQAPPHSSPPPGGKRGGDPPRRGPGAHSLAPPPRVCACAWGRGGAQVRQVRKRLREGPER